MYPKLTDVEKFTNLLHEIPDSTLQVKNFLSQAGVQFLSIITSALGMTQLQKTSGPSGFYEGTSGATAAGPNKQFGWDVRILHLLSTAYSKAIAGLIPLFDKTFGVDAEVRRSEQIINFHSYYQEFAVNLVDESNRLVRCLTNQDAQEVRTSAESLFFLPNTGMIRCLSTCAPLPTTLRLSRKES